MWTWIVSAALATPPVRSLCDTGVTVFTCETTNEKVLSVCASPQVSRATGWVRYRFGRPGAVELTFPAVHDEDTSERFRMITFVSGPAFEAGLAHALDFRVNDVRYQVYEAYPPGRRSDRPADRVSAGVRVIGDGDKLLADIACGPRIEGTLVGFPIDWELEDDEAR